MAGPHFITFGCRLNAYESEVMRAHAEQAGLDDAIVFNTKLSTLFVGLYGDDDSPAKQQIRATAESLVQRRNEVIARQHGRGETLEVFFFNTQTAAVWGP